MPVPDCSMKSAAPVEFDVIETLPVRAGEARFALRSSSLWRSICELRVPEIEPQVPPAPAGPCGPVAPVSPRGIEKSKTAAEDVPTFVMLAEEPAAPVVTVPTPMVAAVPAGPVAPAAPAVPAGPVGMPKFSTYAGAEPVTDTVAGEPGAPVVVVPAVRLKEFAEFWAEFAAAVARFA